LVSGINGTGTYLPLSFYTNGSQQMRLDTSGNLGIGTSSPSVKLQLSGTSSGATLELFRLANTGSGASTASQMTFYAANSNYAQITGGYGASSPILTYNVASSGYQAWQNSGTEQMRLTSAGYLGIGTTSPNNLLTVNGIACIGGVLGSTPNVQIGSNGFGNYIQSINSAGIGANTFNFYQGGSIAYTLDIYGNLGLGVTPSAWGSTNGGAFQFGSGYSSLYSYSNAVTIGSNVYYNAGNKYFASGVGSSAYQQLGGVHYWLNAPSGTAGNAITFTQAMTLDNSGRLGLGTTSPGATFDVKGIKNTGTSLIGIAGSLSSNDYGELGFTDSTSTIYAGLRWIFLNPSSNGSTALSFLTNNGSITTEAARIDSSGTLLVGKTSSAATSVGFQVDGTGALYTTKSTSTSADATYYLYSTGAGAYRFYVGMDGTIHATSTSITAISDQSLKTNVKPLETGLAQVMALQPRRFDWINGDATNVAGFIAQEVEQVLPDLVAPFKYTDTETKLGLKMGDMIPTLVKAIQELKAELDTLKAKVGN